MYLSSAFLLAYGLALVALAQRFFIDAVPEYTLLSACAETPISTIVRDMVNGCGDGGATTSYSCFCTKSSSFFSNMISTKVAADCGGDSAEATSAAAVFSSYCQLDKPTVTTTSPSEQNTSESLFPLGNSTAYTDSIGARSSTTAAQPASKSVQALPTSGTNAASPLSSKSVGSFVGVSGSGIFSVMPALFVFGLF